MKRNIFIVFMLLALGMCQVSYAQSGGRKREKHARKGPRRGNYLHKQYKSAGHADEFARGSNGRFKKYSKLFHRSKPAWQYHTVGSVRSVNKANKFLFTRYRSKGKIENTNELYRRKKIRDRNRVHGSQAFKRPRNYKSR